jgi:hypothetical protein
MNRYSVAALAGGAALLVGGGTALAAQGNGGLGDGDRAARCETLLAKIAEKRGVSVDQLQADVKARLTARIDAALEAGRISPEQAAMLKERVAAGQICKAPHAVKVKLAKRGAFRAAAGYLGLSLQQLRAQLPGTSLGALAEKQGKSVEGLKAAMLAPAKAKLAKAVESGRIRQARADQALERLEKLVDRLVAKTFPAK